MMAPTTKAKLYYLPTAEPVTAPPPVSHWTMLRRRFLRGWWRARLALAVRIGVRSRRRRGDDDEYAAFLGGVVGDSPGELIDRRRRKPSRPAVVLDFEAARLRLRPQTT